MKLRSIKTKVTLTVISGFIVLLGLVSAIQAYRIKADMRQVLGDQQFTLVSRVAGEIDEKLGTAHRALIEESKAIPAELARDPERLRKNLENRPGVRSLFSALFVYSADGTTLIEMPAYGLLGINVRDREYFRQTLENRRPQISQPFFGRGVKREPIVILTAPILDQRGSIVAVLAGSLSLLQPNFLGQLSTASVGKTGSFALLGRDRTIILSRNKDRVMAPGPAPGVSTYFDHAMAGEEGWEESISGTGLRAVFSYKQLGAVPWVLVAALPVDEAYAPIAAAQKRMIEIAIVLALLLAPLVWFGTRYLIDPLLGLRDAIRRARDDPGAVPEVRVRSGDEIGDLAADFNALMRERNQAAAALRESAHRLGMITDNTPALISYVDAEERYRYANGTYREWFGLVPEEIQGRTMREVLGEIYASREPHIRAALSGKEARFDLPVTFEGRERYTHTRYVPDILPDGSVAGFYVLASDVTPLKQTEQRLRESEQQLSLALEGSQLAFFDWNIATGEIFLSERWAVMLGGMPAPTRTTFAALAELSHPDDSVALRQVLRDVLKGSISHYRVEYRVRAKDGKWVWIQTHGQVTARDHRDGRAVRMVGTAADVTERKRAEADLAESRAQLERAAQHDSLTGLPNRNLLNDRLEQALARARRSRQLISLLYLDLDRFKEINDELGHAAGDALLKAFAERLNACVRETDTVARLGGDEFVILLEDVREDRDARAVADKIIDAMRRDFRLESKALRATTSIGVAFTRGESTGEELMKQADAALYEAKRSGRNKYHVARPALEVIDGTPPGRGAKSDGRGKS